MFSPDREPSPSCAAPPVPLPREEGRNSASNINTSTRGASQQQQQPPLARTNSSHRSGSQIPSAVATNKPQQRSQDDFRPTEDDDDNDGILEPPPRQDEDLLLDSNYDNNNNTVANSAPIAAASSDATTRTTTTTTANPLPQPVAADMDGKNTNAINNKNENDKYNNDDDDHEPTPTKSNPPSPSPAPTPTSQQLRTTSINHPAAASTSVSTSTLLKTTNTRTNVTTTTRPPAPLSSSAASAPGSRKNSPAPKKPASAATTTTTTMTLMRQSPSPTNVVITTVSPQTASTTTTAMSNQLRFQVPVSSSSSPSSSSSVYQNHLQQQQQQQQQPQSLVVVKKSSTEAAPSTAFMMSASPAINTTSRGQRPSSFSHYTIQYVKDHSIVSKPVPTAADSTSQSPPSFFLDVVGPVTPASGNNNNNTVNSNNPVNSNNARITIRALQVIEDSNVVWAAEKDGRIAIFDAKTGAIKRRFERRSEYFPVCLTYAAPYVWVGFNDGTVRVFDPDSVACMKEAKEHSGPVNCFEAPIYGQKENSEVFSAGADFMIVRWNAVTVERISVINAHCGPLRSLSWFASCDVLICGGDEGSLKAWTMSPPPPATAPPTQPSSSASLSTRQQQQNGSATTDSESQKSASEFDYFASPSPIGTFFANSKTNNETAGATQQAQESSPIGLLAIAPDAHRQGVLCTVVCQHLIWSGGSDGSVKIWELAATRAGASASNSATSFKLIHEIKAPHTHAVSKLIRVGDNVWSVCLGTIFVWSGESFGEVARYSGEHSGYITSASVIKEAAVARLWTAGAEGGFCVWNAEADLVPAARVSTHSFLKLSALADYSAHLFSSPSSSAANNKSKKPQQMQQQQQQQQSGPSSRKSSPVANNNNNNNNNNNKLLLSKSLGTQVTCIVNDNGVEELVDDNNNDVVLDDADLVDRVSPIESRSESLNCNNNNNQNDSAVPFQQSKTSGQQRPSTSTMAAATSKSSKPRTSTPSSSTLASTTTTTTKRKAVTASAPTSSSSDKPLSKTSSPPLPPSSSSTATTIKSSLSSSNEIDAAIKQARAVLKRHGIPTDETWRTLLCSTIFSTRLDAESVCKNYTSEASQALDFPEIDVTSLRSIMANLNFLVEEQQKRLFDIAASVPGTTRLRHLVFRILEDGETKIPTSALSLDDWAFVNRVWLALNRRMYIVNVVKNEGVTAITPSKQEQHDHERQTSDGSASVADFGVTVMPAKIANGSNYLQDEQQDNNNSNNIIPSLSDAVEGVANERKSFPSDESRFASDQSTAQLYNWLEKQRQSILESLRSCATGVASNRGGGGGVLAKQLGLANEFYLKQKLLLEQQEKGRQEVRADQAEVFSNLVMIKLAFESALRKVNSPMRHAKKRTLGENGNMISSTTSSSVLSNETSGVVVAAARQEREGGEQQHHHADEARSTPIQGHDQFYSLSSRCNANNDDEERGISEIDDICLAINTTAQLLIAQHRQSQRSVTNRYAEDMENFSIHLQHVNDKFVKQQEEIGLNKKNLIQKTKEMHKLSLALGESVTENTKLRKIVEGSEAASNFEFLHNQLEKTREELNTMREELTRLRRVEANWNDEKLLRKQQQQRRQKPQQHEGGDDAGNTPENKYQDDADNDDDDGGAIDNDNNKNNNNDSLFVEEIYPSPSPSAARVTRQTHDQVASNMRGSDGLPHSDRTRWLASLVGSEIEKRPTKEVQHRNLLQEMQQLEVTMREKQDSSVVRQRHAAKTLAVDLANAEVTRDVALEMARLLRTRVEFFEERDAQWSKLSDLLGDVARMHIDSFVFAEPFDELRMASKELLAVLDLRSTLGRACGEVFRLLGDVVKSLQDFRQATESRAPTRGQTLDFVDRTENRVGVSREGVKWMLANFFSESELLHLGFSPTIFVPDERRIKPPVPPSLMVLLKSSPGVGSVSSGLGYSVTSPQRQQQQSTLIDPWQQQQQHQQGFNIQSTATSRTTSNPVQQTNSHGGNVMMVERDYYQPQPAAHAYLSAPMRTEDVQRE